ncbi:hypothetical protein B0H19DRAFT_1146502 [Mycena capillaripes]|nr:hypothetical protein B0H19DRAFT_1146502 [Mycena capillaripes]
MSSAFLAPVSAGPSMRIRGVDVPNDVLGTVLSSSPDFDTLRAAMGVCSTWHRAFETHPKSVVLAVARNIVGPALPQAVRFLRYPYPEKTQNHWGDAEEDGGEEEEDPEATEDDSEDESAGPSKRKAQKAKKRGPAPHNPMAFLESKSIGQLTPAERMRLQKNAETVHRLEEIFSLRYKDRNLKKSKLTGLESHRFARAMYRVMLYCELFYLPLNLDDIDSMEDDDGVLDKIQKARHTMLNEYSTSELLEINAVVAFLRELISEAVDDDDFERLKDICLATGPTVILHADRDRSTDPFEEALEVEVMSSGENNALFGGFFSKPLETIWEEREVEPPAFSMDAILDEVIGQSDKCAQCGVVGGVKLWTEANWENLISVDFCALLLGKLNENEVETEALVDLLMAPTCGAEVVISEIFDMRTPEFFGWKREDSLCSACLDKFIGGHLHLWLYKRKVADGWKATQNCWYGYNCKTQVHKINHGKEKNHLCVPLR